MNLNKLKKTFIIAEIGNNHEGSFNVACKLITEAKKAGVDAVKFQTFKTEDFISPYEKKRFKKLKKFELSYEDLQAKWNEQGGLCLYTNWKMSTITNDPKLVSVERKDNSKPYSKENVILVCWCANRAKNIMVFGQFLEMCQAVVEKQISEGSLT